MNLSDPLLLLLLLVGPFVGSFLGVLADRLPRGESVVWGRSRCPRCKTALRVPDLVPILSYIWLRGACRHCNAPIAPWILYLELSATGAAVMAIFAAPGPITAWIWAGFLWVLLVLAACDLTRYRLPDPLTLMLFLCTLILAVLPGGVGLWSALVGAIAGVSSFAALRWGYRALRGREGLGLGDVKLMAGLGAWAGPWDLPLLVLIAALGALLAALVVQIVRPSRRRGPVAYRALPFGAALCGAAAVLWVMRAFALPMM